MGKCGGSSGDTQGPDAQKPAGVQGLGGEVSAPHRAGLRTDPLPRAAEGVALPSIQEQLLRKSPGSCTASSHTTHPRETADHTPLDPRQALCHRRAGGREAEPTTYRRRSKLQEFYCLTNRTPSRAGVPEELVAKLRPCALWSCTFSALNVFLKVSDTPFDHGRPPGRINKWIIL